MRNRLLSISLASSRLTILQEELFVRRLAPLATFILAGSLFAQAASFSTYGTGCKGSGLVSQTCYGQNQNGGTFRFQKQNSLHFALRFTPTTNTVVLGFDLYMRTQTAPSATLSTQIFAANAAGHPTNPALRTGTVTVGSQLGFYRTTFTPLPVTKGSTYYVAYVGNTQVYFPHILTAKTSQHYWRSSPTGAWNGPWTNPYWSWRVVCGVSGAIPKISSTGLPKIGSSFSVNLSLARPNAKALFAIGGAKTSFPWPSAPGCTLLLTNPLAVYGLQTTASGTLSIPLGKVPNNPKLIGLVGYTQFAVADPVNAAGIVFSDGGQATVGR